MSLQNLLTIRSIRVYSGSKLYKVEPSYSKTISGGFKPFSTSSALPVENKSLICGIDLSWEKFGNGPHIVLCLPGFLGSAALNFHPVCNKMNLEKFTLIAWDPPGFGKSRPPDRDILTEHEHSLIKDAHLAGALMKELGYDKYSLIGYSNGGLSGALLAASQPENIEKLVMCSTPFTSCKCYTRLSKIMNAMVDLDCWDPTQLKETLDTYEKPYLMKMLWDMKKWVTQQSKSNTFNKFCSDEMKKNLAPTLYIRSMKDVVVPAGDAEEYRALIQNFKLHKVHKGGHNHLEYVDEFVAACESFLLPEENRIMTGGT